MSLGITAAAFGDDVVFVFAFEALKSLAHGTFGKPLTDRERLFPEDIDKSDPWQFKNVRVV